MTISNREYLAILLGVNLAVMEMMFSIGSKTNKNLDKNKMNDKMFEIIKEICGEDNIDIKNEDLDDLIPSCYKAIMRSNDMCERIMGK